MKRTCKASTVVEMAYLMPVVLLCWIAVVFALFYYHDKNVIAGAAYEAAVAGTELWVEETEYRSAKIEDYFRERINRKLLFYRNVDIHILINQTEIRVEVFAVKYLMTLHVEEQATVTQPEKVIRDRLILKETVEDVTE